MENKCKFFAWTLVQKKILTSNNLALRGWSIQSPCPLCHLHAETSTHLCLSCSYAWEVWSSVMGASGFDLSLCWCSQMSLLPCTPGGKLHRIVLRRSVDENSMELLSTSCGIFGRKETVASFRASRRLPRTWWSWPFRPLTFTN